MGFARADKLDAISGDAVMLRLIGLSDPTVQVDPAARSAGSSDTQFRRDRPPQKHRPHGKADPRAHQRRHDRRTSRKGSSIARSHSQSFAHRFRARPRPQAALAVAISRAGCFGQIIDPRKPFLPQPWSLATIRDALTPIKRSRFFSVSRRPRCGLLRGCLHGGVRSRLRHREAGN